MEPPHGCALFDIGGSFGKVMGSLRQGFSPCGCERVHLRVRICDRERKRDRERERPERDQRERPERETREACKLLAVGRTGVEYTPLAHSPL